MIENPTLMYTIIAVAVSLFLIVASVFLSLHFMRISRALVAYRGEKSGRPIPAFWIPPLFRRHRMLRDYVPLYDFFGRFGPMELEFQDDRGARGKRHAWRVVLAREGFFARKRLDGSLSRFEEYAVSWDQIRRIRVADFPAHRIDIRLSRRWIHMRLNAKADGLEAFQDAMEQLETAASWAFLLGRGRRRAFRGPFCRTLRNPYALGLAPKIPTVPEAFAQARRFRAQSTAIEAPDEIPRARREPDEELDNETARIIRWENQEVLSL